jgi:Tfp pilus assembly protein FimT
MMSVVLLALSMALAMPSFRDMVEKRQITNGAEQIAAFINTVQGVALKTNSRVTVTYDEPSDGNWCIGAFSPDVTATCDCTETTFSEGDYCKVGSDSFVLNQDVATGRDLMHSMSGDGAYTFDPVRGLSDDTLAMELRSQNGDFRLSLMVNNVGRVTLCSTDEEHAIPGYKVCEDGS